MKTNLEDMFPDEVDRVLSEDSPAAVIPIASVEQHGPHLLLGCDGFITRMLAAETARLAGAVLFPMVPHSWIGGLRIWPGTVDISSRAMGDYLESVCLEACRMGFRRILVVNAHGGGREMVFSVVRRVFRKTGVAIFATFGGGESARTDEITAVWEAHGVHDRAPREASQLAGSLDYLERPDLLRKVLATIESCVAESGEPEQFWRPESLERAFRVGEVGHDYLDEIRHAAPRSNTTPEGGAKVVAMLARTLAGALDDLETCRLEREKR